MPEWPPARACEISYLPNYGLAADAAAAAASAAELAAAAASEAAEAAESAAGAMAAGGGGGGSAAGGGASVLLPQALSMNAAATALRASLVFIYRYPGNNIRNEILRPSVLLGIHPCPLRF